MFANAFVNKIHVFSPENKIQVIVAVNDPSCIYGIKQLRHAFVAETKPALLEKFSVLKNALS